MSLRTVIEINHDHLRPSQLEELKLLFAALKDGSTISNLIWANDYKHFGWSAGIRILGQFHHTENVTHIPFQNRVLQWMLACFGKVITNDKVERNHRFFEEATELVQAGEMTASECHQLVDYVFNRPVGEKKQEVGGVMVTLAAWCIANKIDMHECGEIELDRIWAKMEQIRTKQAAKPKHSPLPA